MNDPMQKLSLFDPDLAGIVREGFERKQITPDETNLKLLVDETLWGLSEEGLFGRAVAEGYVELIGSVDQGLIRQYRNLVREAFQHSGPTLGKIMAEALVPVIKFGDRSFLDRFVRVTRIMRSTGVYTLSSPLSALASILESGSIPEGKAFLRILEHTFGQELTYNQSKQLSNTLSQSVLSFSAGKRGWLLEELDRVILMDVNLAESFIESLKKGLMLLDHNALSSFVSIGIEKFKKKPELGKKFLALESKLGLDTCLELQRKISFGHVRQRLIRYLQARTGLSVAVRPLSDFSETTIGQADQTPSVISDGSAIYLPDEIGISSSKEGNFKYYKMLVQLEAGYFEFRTFDFDFEKALNRCKEKKVIPDEFRDHEKRLDSTPRCSDMELFFRLFPCPSLAKELFTIIEHGRLQVLMSRFYPGMLKQILPLLRQDVRETVNEENGETVLSSLYSAVVLQEEAPKNTGGDFLAAIERVAELFADKIREDDSVETVAEVVFLSYPVIADLLQEKPSESRSSMKIPFNRILRPELYFSTFEGHEHIAYLIKSIFDQKGIIVYRSEIRRSLREHGGKLSPDTIRNLILESENRRHLSENDLQKVFSEPDFSAFSEIPGWQEDIAFQELSEPFPTYRYREWDDTLGDYLQDHVLVREKSIVGLDEGFYENALKLYQGLIKKIQVSFELLKPEGLKILRRWREGDEFDYRAMIDFAIEKKAGLLPSDRLYTKRIKKNRDVSVLLLVDLSRSTASNVAGTDKTVLMIEKESIVLLCEALKVVGDSFSIAGFSGTGRFGVDYYTIKGFDDKMSRDVIQRINGMKPLRSTRLGAAIRHAASNLDKASSTVRLLLILGDGFPNDTGYKNQYAMEDTRRALLEARSKNIYAHSILVNIAGDSRLDSLYGKIRHTVISDVCDLPDKLLRIYRDLTR
ncbi:MAG: VWA domain-containing protein [Desulfobacterales bacterium]